MRADDSISDLDRHERVRALDRRTLPRCCECGAYLYDEEVYIIDGETFCPDCIGIYDEIEESE